MPDSGPHPPIAVETLRVIDPVDPRVLRDRHVDDATAMPYMRIMHTVMWTPTFLRQAEQLNLSEDELDLIADTLSSDPRAGDMISGTGGARKLRHPGRGRGKSGGLRTIHHFAGDDVPVFLLSVYSKGTKDSLTKGERNKLAAHLAGLADHYRESTGQVAGQPRPTKDTKKRTIT